MTKKQHKERDGLVHLDPEKLQRQATRLGLTKSQLAENADVSRNTVYRAFSGAGVFPNIAVCLAEALAVEDVAFLFPSGPGGVQQAIEREAGGEWHVESYLSPWVTASNGLQFRTCQMRHQFLEQRLGRGKWYDLLHLSGPDRDRLRSHLLRHPNVCERIGVHPHIAENLSTLPRSDDEGWWVIDRWVGTPTLQEVVENGPYPPANVAQLMTQVALGLEALHRAQVVFRELAPSRVILAEDDGRAVLTDFELAKLLDTGPTVSADWPEDPYRAPEVESGTVDESSDLYSWARMLVHAATGTLPPKGGDADAVLNAGLPKGMWRMVTDCLSPAPIDRPRSMQPILRSLPKWR